MDETGEYRVLKESELEMCIKNSSPKCEGYLRYIFNYFPSLIGSADGKLAQLKNPNHVLKAYNISSYKFIS